MSYRQRLVQELKSALQSMSAENATRGQLYTPDQEVIIRGLREAGVSDTVNAAMLLESLQMPGQQVNVQDVYSPGQANRLEVQTPRVADRLGARMGPSNVGPNAQWQMSRQPTAPVRQVPTAESWLLGRQTAPVEIAGLLPSAGQSSFRGVTSAEEISKPFDRVVEAAIERGLTTDPYAPASIRSGGTRLTNADILASDAANRRLLEESQRLNSEEKAKVIDEFLRAKGQPSLSEAFGSGAPEYMGITRQEFLQSQRTPQSETRYLPAAGETAYTGQQSTRTTLNRPGYSSPMEVTSASYPRTPVGTSLTQEQANANDSQYRQILEESSGLNAQSRKAAIEEAMRQKGVFSTPEGLGSGSPEYTGRTRDAYRTPVAGPSETRIAGLLPSAGGTTRVEAPASSSDVVMGALEDQLYGRNKTSDFSAEYGGRPAIIDQPGLETAQQRIVAQSATQPDYYKRPAVPEVAATVNPQYEGHHVANDNVKNFLRSELSKTGAINPSTSIANENVLSTSAPTGPQRVGAAENSILRSIAAASPRAQADIGPKVGPSSPLNATGFEAPKGSIVNDILNSLRSAPATEKLSESGGFAPPSTINPRTTSDAILREVSAATPKRVAAAPDAPPISGPASPMRPMATRTAPFANAFPTEVPFKESEAGLRYSSIEGQSIVPLSGKQYQQNTGLGEGRGRGVGRGLGMLGLGAGALAGGMALAKYLQDRNQENDVAAPEDFTKKVAGDLNRIHEGTGVGVGIAGGRMVAVPRGSVMGNQYVGEGTAQDSVRAVLRNLGLM